MNNHRFANSIVVLICTLFLTSCPRQKADTDPVTQVQGKPALSVIAVGDIMLARAVGRLAHTAGYDNFFNGFDSYTKNADVVFGNLETTVTHLIPPGPSQNSPPVFRAEPGVLFGLKRAGFNLVSLANNHMYDSFAGGAAETADYLDTIGISYSGAGASLFFARTPGYVETKGSLVALLAYCKLTRQSPEATSESSGVAPIRRDMILADIATLKSNFRKPDYILVALHWAEEYATLPTQDHIKLAHDIIDAGATVVLGSHPHVLQGIERYKNGVIFYSLGNFIFDMTASETKDTVLAQFELASGAVGTILIIPARIDSKYTPQPVVDSEANRILALVTDRSASFKTQYEKVNNTLVIR